MTVSSINPIIQQTNQQFFIEKNTQALTNIVQDCLTPFAEFRNNPPITPIDFVAKHITTKQAALNTIDQRTGQLFQQILQDVMQMPAINFITPMLTRIGTMVGDENITAKYITGIAYPHVQTLIADLDARSPAIINDALENV